MVAQWVGPVSDIPGRCACGGAGCPRVHWCAREREREGSAATPTRTPSHQITSARKAMQTNRHGTWKGLQSRTYSVDACSSSSEARCSAESAECASPLRSAAYASRCSAGTWPQLALVCVGLPRTSPSAACVTPRREARCRRRVSPSLSRSDGGARRTRNLSM